MLKLQFAVIHMKDFLSMECSHTKKQSVELE